MSGFEDTSIDGFMADLASSDREGSHTPTGSSRDRKLQFQPPQVSAFDSRFSNMSNPMHMTSPGAREAYANDGIQFQLPSFLLGAPTPAAGGGADVLPGSFSSISELSNWFGGGSNGDE